MVNWHVKGRKPVVEMMEPMVVEIMQKKTPEERLAIAFRMWDNAREMIQGTLQDEYPEWSAEQIQIETAWRMRGKNDNE